MLYNPFLEFLLYEEKLQIQIQRYWNNLNVIFFICQSARTLLFTILLKIWMVKVHWCFKTISNLGLGSKLARIRSRIKLWPKSKIRFQIWFRLTMKSKVGSEHNYPLSYPLFCSKNVELRCFSHRLMIWTVQHRSRPLAWRILKSLLW